MSALVARYAAPTGNFDRDSAIEVQQLVETKVRALLDFDAIVDGIQEAIEALGDDAKPSARSAAPIALEGEGFARVQRICTGFGAPPPPIDKAANGFLELTVGYSDDGLDSVVFGGAIDCKEEVSGVRMNVAGDVHLFVGEGTQIADLAATTFVFELESFTFEANDTPLISGGFDFEVCRGEATTCVPGHFGMLLTLGSGTTLVAFIDLVTKTGGFRAANGVWTCNFLTGECSDPQGAMVTFPAYQL